jgi:hypothetical protein
MAAIRACGVIIALAPAAVARPQRTNRRRAGLLSRATALLTGVPAAARAAAAVAACAAGAAAAPAGPSVIIAPARTVTVMPAPSAAVAIRVLATRLISCPVIPGPAMHSSVGLPPEMTSSTAMTPEPARRFAPICKVWYRRGPPDPWRRSGCLAAAAPGGAPAVPKPCSGRSPSRAPAVPLGVLRPFPWPCPGRERGSPRR